MDIIKEKITSKSLELFINIGVKVVTMDMISEALGMSKKTLYEHFSSKEELIKQTFNERLTLTFSELENKIANYQNAIQQKFLILKSMKTLFFIKEDQISFQLGKFYPSIYSEILDIQEHFIKTLLQNNMLIGVEEGLYRSKINKKLTAEYYYLVERAILNENNIMVDNYFLELLLRSIATKKGIKELEKILKTE